jgi:predicted DNA-binding protein
LTAGELRPAPGSRLGQADQLDQVDQVDQVDEHCSGRCHTVRWSLVIPRHRHCLTRAPYIVPYTREAMRKTSVYLDEQQAERLARLARQEGRSQAEILRAAIAAYQPAPSRDRDFALATGFARIDRDPRPISQIPDHELLEGFGG